MRGLFKTIFMTALLGGVAGPVAAQDAGPVYAAKMVCGFQPDLEALQLVQGVYATVVNLLNISGSKQSVIVTFAMAHPPSAPMPGGGYDVAEVTLAPGQAAAVDCEDLAALTFPFGFPDTYIDGFVLIAGQGPLTVRAVYTAAPFEKDGCCQGHPGQVASIDVERIEAVPMAEGTEPLPDLLPEAPVRSQDPQGQPGTGFCGQVPANGGPPGALALVRNDGTGGAGASVARFDFGTYGTVDRPVPALAPGEEHPIEAAIPTACFGSALGGTCAFDVVADSGKVVVERLEGNNIGRGFCLRAPAQVRP